MSKYACFTVITNITRKSQNLMRNDVITVMIHHFLMIQVLVASYVRHINSRKTEIYYYKKGDNDVIIP